jgi:hypothetical protein
VKWAALFGYNLCYVQKEPKSTKYKNFNSSKTRRFIDTQISLKRRSRRFARGSCSGGRERVELVDRSEDYPKLGPKTQVLVFGPDNLLLLTNLLVSPRSFNYIDPN